MRAKSDLHICVSKPTWTGHVVSAPKGSAVQDVVRESALEPSSRISWVRGKGESILPYFA